MTNLFLVAFIAIVVVFNLLLVMVTPTVYAFKVFNVNLNKTIDLPVATTYPKTTIKPGSCVGLVHIDITKPMDTTTNERIHNPEMFKSDFSTILVLTSMNPNNKTAFSWCGLDK